MKITNQDLKAMKDPLIEYAELDTESPRFSYVVGNAIIILEPYYKSLEEAERKIYLKHVDKDEEGNPVQVNEVLQFTDIEALEKDLIELYEIEVEVPELTKFTLEDFKAAKVTTNGKKMARLRHLISTE